MAVEARRKCGYRKVGKLYLEGDWLPIECDRDLRLKVCPVCGHGIRQQRGWHKIVPLHLFGVHGAVNGTPVQVSGACKCVPTCMMCYPPEGVHGLLWVGRAFYKTPNDFVAEAKSLGISKAIPAIPHWFEIGKSVVYLAHPKCKMMVQDEGELMPTLKEVPGVFLAWRPLRITRLFWESQRNSDAVKEWEKRGVTPKFVPDGDKHHDPRTPLVPKDEDE